MPGQSEQLDEWRCDHCHQLLGKYSVSPGFGIIEVRCHHCKALCRLSIDGHTLIDAIAERVIREIERRFVINLRTFPGPVS